MIQVYTGNGKGKTTAAFGLALRAAGCGFKVYIAQFAKGRECGEHKILRSIKKIKLERFGRAGFIYGKPGADDCKAAARGLAEVKKAIQAGKYRVIILDELNVALKCKLLDLNEFLLLLDTVPEKTELILTGRDAPQKLIQRADLVSLVKEVKHYYRRGIKARKGIEF